MSKPPIAKPITSPTTSTQLTFHTELGNWQISKPPEGKAGPPAVFRDIYKVYDVGPDKGKPIVIGSEISAGVPQEFEKAFNKAVYPHMFSKPTGIPLVQSSPPKLTPNQQIALLKKAQQLPAPLQDSLNFLAGKHGKKQRNSLF